MDHRDSVFEIEDDKDVVTVINPEPPMASTEVDLFSNSVPSLMDSSAAAPTEPTDGNTRGLIWNSGTTMVHTTTNASSVAPTSAANALRVLTPITGTASDGTGAGSGLLSDYTVTLTSGTLFRMASWTCVSR